MPQTSPERAFRSSTTTGSALRRVTGQSLSTLRLLCGSWHLPYESRFKTCSKFFATWHEETLITLVSCGSTRGEVATTGPLRYDSRYRLVLVWVSLWEKNMFSRQNMSKYRSSHVPGAGLAAQRLPPRKWLCHNYRPDSSDVLATSFRSSRGGGLNFWTMSPKQSQVLHGAFAFNQYCTLVGPCCEGD